MSLHALVLLLVLLPLPPEDLPPECPVASACLRDLAELLELWPPGEHWNGYRTELPWVQRWQRRAYNAPRLADVHRLPPAATARAYVEMNEAYRSWHKAQPEYRQDDMALEAAAWQHTFWTLAVEAANESDRCWASRRVKLAELRELLGWENYYAGRWPAFVPHWRFRPID